MFYLCFGFSVAPLLIRVEEYIINKCIIIIIPKHPVVVEIYLSGLKWMTVRLTLPARGIRWTIDYTFCKSNPWSILPAKLWTNQVWPKCVKTWCELRGESGWSEQLRDRSVLPHIITFICQQALHNVWMRPQPTTRADGFPTTEAHFVKQAEIRVFCILQRRKKLLWLYSWTHYWPLSQQHFDM